MVVENDDTLTSPRREKKGQQWWTFNDRSFWGDGRWVMRLSAKSLSAAISQTEALVHLKTRRGEKPNIRSSISELQAFAAEHIDPNYKAPPKQKV